MPGLQAGLKVDFSGYCGFCGDSVFAWFLVLTVEVGKVNLLWPYSTVVGLCAQALLKIFNNPSLEYSFSKSAQFSAAQGAYHLVDIVITAEYILI